MLKLGLVTFVLVLVSTLDGRVLRTLKNERKPLRFNENGKFKILNFADLHYGEHPYGNGPALDVETSELIGKLVEWESPDLVVYTGDQIYGDTIGKNATDYVEQAIQPLIASGTRWAMTYGNHDRGRNVTRMEIFNTESKYENSYTSYDHPELPGISNYRLFVYPFNGDDARPSLVLWFFDSQGGHDADRFYLEIVDKKVVEWFKTEDLAIKEQWGNIPALAFFHIPFTQYNAAKSMLDENPKCGGLSDEKVFAQDLDSGLAEALLSSGTVKTVFVGHDHNNGWCCYYKTLEVCYNRHTGRNGYGSHPHGSRVVVADEFDPWGTFDNYIRIEDGTVQDYFPVIQKEKFQN